MSQAHRDERFADELLEVVELLRQERPALDPLALDRVKLRVIRGARRSTTTTKREFFMRSRLTTALTIAFFGLGTGGALALVGHEDLGLGGGGSGSASFSQYRNCEHGVGHGADTECHGKAGEEHGKAGEEHGKAGEEHGKAGEEHGHGH